LANRGSGSRPDLEIDGSGFKSQTRTSGTPKGYACQRRVGQSREARAGLPWYRPNHAKAKAGTALRPRAAKTPTNFTQRPRTRSTVSPMKRPISGSKSRQGQRQSCKGLHMPAKGWPIRLKREPAYPGTAESRQSPRPERPYAPVRQDANQHPNRQLHLPTIDEANRFCPCRWPGQNVSTTPPPHFSSRAPARKKKRGPSKSSRRSYFVGSCAQSALSGTTNWPITHRIGSRTSVTKSFIRKMNRTLN